LEKAGLCQLLIVVHCKFPIQVTDSIHELMGNTSAVGSKNSQAHVTRIFETMDQNQDGKVTLEEFVNYCTTQKDVRQSLMVSSTSNGSFQK
jgi:hypothetical protein